MKKIRIEYMVDSQYGSQTSFDVSRNVNDIVLIEHLGSIINSFGNAVDIKLMFLTTLVNLGLHPNEI